MQINERYWEKNKNSFDIGTIYMLYIIKIKLKLKDTEIPKYWFQLTQKMGQPETQSFKNWNELKQTNYIKTLELMFLQFWKIIFSDFEWPSIYCLCSFHYKTL